MSEDTKNLSKSNETDTKIRVKGDDLRQINIYSYSIGHFFNDICASCWFNFVSYFLVYIVELKESDAGLVLLAGQIFDGLATPIVGILSDNTNSRFGKRTPWYVFGTIIVMLTFTLIFQDCLICSKDSEEFIKVIYYSVNASLFNIGWAAVQVAHMALLPSLSLSKKRQEQMIRLRTGFTFGSMFLSLVLSLVLFYFISDKILQYSVLAISCAVIGFSTSVFFLIKCRESVLSKNIPVYYDQIKLSLNNINQSNDNKDNLLNNEDADLSGDEEPISKPVKAETENINWLYWMKIPDFYVYLLVYMFVRLAINVSSAMIPFYCEIILAFKKSDPNDHSTPIEIPIVLIIMTFGSMINSVMIEGFIQSKTTKKTFRLVLFISSTLFLLAGCVPLIFLDSGNSNYIIFGVAFFLGIGFAQGLSGASSLINDVVGTKGSQGAFVYGAYSFSDKMSNGVALYFLLAAVKTHGHLLTYLLGIFPPIAIIIALMLVYFRGLCKQSNDRKDKEFPNSNQGRKKQKSIIEDSRLTFINNNTKFNNM